MFGSQNNSVKLGLLGIDPEKQRMAKVMCEPSVRLDMISLDDE